MRSLVFPCETSTVTLSASRLLKMPSVGQASSNQTTICGKPIGAIGYGMMGLTSRNMIRFEDATQTLRAALENGASFWNGGMFYGPTHANSLHLLRQYFTRYPEDASKVVLSIKGAFDRSAYVPDCSPEGIRKAVAECLGILGGVKSIDIFECARVDPKVPIETSVATLKELIEEGKIGGYGLTEVNATTIRRAHAVHPVAAVEIELSIFTRHVLEENGVAETCRDLGIPLIAYAPLDRGWLTGEIKSYFNLPAGDFRQKLPRFQPGAFEQNVKLANAVHGIAQRKGCTVAQVALAWVTRHGAIPIPGATKMEKVVENCTLVELSDAEVEEIQYFIETLAIVGDRYPKAYQSLLDL